MKAQRTKEKLREKEVPRPVATTADLVMKFGLGCPDSPFFRLTQPERERVEADLVRQLVEIFPLKVRKSWLNQTFPLKFRGPGNKVIELDPATLDSQREYLRLYFEFKLRDLPPVVKAPTGFQDSEPVYTTEETPPDDPCVMCVIIDRQHVCMRCADVERYGEKLVVFKDTRLGRVEAQVSVQLSWSQPV
jgi:hypothetical protein